MSNKKTLYKIQNVPNSKSYPAPREIVEVELTTVEVRGKETDYIELDGVLVPETLWSTYGYIFRTKKDAIKVLKYDLKARIANSKDNIKYTKEIIEDEQKAIREEEKTIQALTEQLKNLK